jgi:hypothetical protein
MNNDTTLVTALVVATMFELIGIAQPTAPIRIRLLSLTDNNSIVSFDLNDPSKLNIKRVHAVRL